MTEEADEFVLDVGQDYQPVMVICSRLDIVPAPNDYKIVDAGLKLYIQDAGQGHADRIGILDRLGDEYVFVIFQGEQPDAALQQRIDDRIRSFPD